MCKFFRPRWGVLFLILGCKLVFVNGQVDTTRGTAVRDSSIRFTSETDSLAVPDSSNGFFRIFFPGKRPPFDPEIAWKRSLIFPGWGQIYNKRWWKLPLIYGTYAGMGVAIKFNHDRYKRYQKAYLERIDDDKTNDNNTFPEGIPNDGILRVRDAYRRNRDFSIILTVGVHLLQVLEAYVDAHLRSFDVSEDISLRLQPALTPLSAISTTSFEPGIRMSLDLHAKNSRK